MTAVVGEIERVAIVGAGLVGGSIALAAREAGVGQVTLTDAKGAVRDRARALGLGHEVVDTVEQAVRDADLVVVAVPAAAVGAVMETCARAAPTTSVLSDVASLKRELTLDVQSRLMAIGGIEAARRFVPGHPMAGSERSGPDAADAHLFDGATWILTPTGTTDDRALRVLSGFLGTLGARVLAVSPERHDELVAIVSHLPQLAASALADVAADAVAAAGEAVLAVAGGGFRDTTRVAASDPDLWVGILTGNRSAVLDALDGYRGRLDALRSAIADGDDTALRAILTRASDARRRMVPKVGVVELVDLVVALADRPGELAAVTTALGEAGLNVEDLAMRHAADGGRGALLVRVAASHAPVAVEILERQGMHVHIEGTVADNALPTALAPPEGE